MNPGVLSRFHIQSKLFKSLLLAAKINLDDTRGPHESHIFCVVLNDLLNNAPRALLSHSSSRILE